jgi:hypothetical protein
VSMSDSYDDAFESTNDEETDALLSRLQLIEDRPLDERAAAFAQVYDELQSTLEGSDSRHRG